MRDRELSTAPAYRAAGVDLAGSDRIKERIGAMVRDTFDERVVGDIGGFGGGYALADPASIVVASADGVGTKVLVAQSAGRHDTVGEDLVNHCVDDLLAARARPLFFLDYIAAGRLDEGVIIDLVAGFCRGCRANGIPLLGGETAEMPDLYPPGRYDLAGFMVGSAVLDDRPPPVPGDIVIGLASSGLHTNGYTLARRTLERAGWDLDDVVPWGDTTWADELLQVHRSYRRAVEPLLDDPALKAVAHITGGGFEGNVPRVLPAGVGARIDARAWPTPPVFETLAEAGDIDRQEMFRVFNMGIGMCVVVSPDRVSDFERSWNAEGEAVYVIGALEPGEGVRWA